MMARITWKGEGASPPPSLEWRGVTFPLGQAVEVDDPAIIAKAKTAVSIFKVEEEAPASAGAGSAPPKPKPAPPPPPPPEPEPEPQPGDDHEEDDDDDEPHRAAHRFPPVRGRAATHHATRKKK